MWRIRQFRALAGLTAAEAFRQPICLLLTTTCVVMTILAPMLMLHHFGEEGRMARDSGLALHFVFGLLVTGFAASSTLSSEIRQGTAALVLSKPVRRDILFLAKFTGTCVVVLAFSACAGLTTLLAERVSQKLVLGAELSGYITDWQTGILILLALPAAYGVAAVMNYRRRRPFESVALAFLLVALAIVFVTVAFFDRAGRFAPFAFRVDWRIIPASLLITLALIVLSAIAVAVAARFGTVVTVSACAVLFINGLAADYVFGRHAQHSTMAAIFYRLVPNWQHFWVADALAGGGRVPGVYMLETALYAVLYTAGVTCLGLLAFRNREIT